MNKFGEPWRIVESPHVWSTVGRIDRADEIAIWPIIDSMTDLDGRVEIALGLADESGHIDRAIACVNACAGMEDPSAVPDLLAALVAVSAGGCWCGVGIDDPGLAGRHTRACEMARAAIGKAQGDAT